MRKWAKSGQPCLVIRTRNAINPVEDANSNYSLLSGLYRHCVWLQQKLMLPRTGKNKYDGQHQGPGSFTSKDFWVQSAALHSWAEGAAKWHP